MHKEHLTRRCVKIQLMHKPPQHAQAHTRFRRSAFNTKRVESGFPLGDVPPAVPFAGTKTEERKATSLMGTCAKRCGSLSSFVPASTCSSTAAWGAPLDSTNENSKTRKRNRRRPQLKMAEGPRPMTVTADCSCGSPFKRCSHGKREHLAGSWK